jgi:DNA-directed RNA polymerase sigma subunit (sigma70/sigma32)
MQTLDKRRDRYLAMQRARDEGKTNAQIGQSFGLTRQRVHTILNNGVPRPNGRPKKETQHA